MARRRTQQTDEKPPHKPATPSAPQPAAPETPQAEPRPDHPPHPPHVPSRWTVENALWVAVIAVAAFVRLFDLGRFSLTDAEAAQALASLNLWSAADAPRGISPLLVGLNAMIFALFGASDATARLVPALAGLVPVAATYWLRPLLGRGGALAAAAMIALSATFVFHARAANGEMLAVAGIVTALVGCYEYARSRRGGAIVVAAAGAGLAFASGTVMYTVLVIGLVLAAATLVVRARGADTMPEWEAAFHSLRGSAETARAALIAFGAALAGGATVALAYPPGLQATLNLAADWLGAFAAPSSAPPSLYLDALVLYELLPFVFGVAGLLIALSRAERTGIFMALWFGVALTLYTIAPQKATAGMLIILLPLTWAGGRAVGSLAETLGEDFSLLNEGTFILLGLITAGIIYVNLTAYAAQSGVTSHLAIVAIGTGMLLMVGVMIAALHAYYHAPLVETGDSEAGALAARGTPAWGEGVRRGAAVLGAIVLCVCAAASVSAVSNLNFRGADNPREALVFERTTLEARALKPMLEQFSDRWTGDPSEAPVAAQAGIGAALRWYLRDFRSVRYVDAAPPTASESIVIVPAAGDQPGFADAYASQRLRWRWLKTDPEPGAAPFLRWLLYRGDQDVLPSYDIIVYVQQR